jgi:integrase
MRASWKQSTRTTATDYRRCHIDGAFKDIYVDSLTEADVAKWFAALTDNAGPGAANRCMDILRAALNKAEAWGYRVENTNPCYAVRCNRKVMRTRHLSEAEMARLGAALADLRDHADQSVRSQAVAITLLLLTGCRRGEILSLQWSDLRGNRLKLRDSKTGPRTVWLGQEAVDLLASHPRSPKVPGSSGTRMATADPHCLYGMATCPHHGRSAGLSAARSSPYLRQPCRQRTRKSAHDRQASGPPLHQIHGPLRASG